MSPFWRDAALLQAEYEKHGTLAGVSRAHDGTPAERTLIHWWAKLGLPQLPRGGPKLHSVPAGPEFEDALLKALKKRKDSATIEELADANDVAPRKIREALERLDEKGYRVTEQEQRVVLHRVPPPSDNIHKALFKGDTVRFGVVSDTHLGSKHCRLEELHYAYKIFADEGISTVYHPGDLVCGKGIYPGQINDIELHSYEEQVNYAVENYPRIKGVTTHIISGNHDLEGEFGKIGANPVVAFYNQRDDFNYLGDYRATVELKQGTRIYLLHPKGGMGYSADYKVRKLAEGFESGSKPNLGLIGHYHRRGCFEARGIQMLLAGCFEGGGSFGARVGLSDPAVGFHIVSMKIAKDGSIVKFLAEWLRFWPGRKVQVAA